LFHFPHPAINEKLISKEENMKKIQRTLGRETEVLRRRSQRTLETRLKLSNQMVRESYAFEQSLIQARMDQNLEARRKLVNTQIERIRRYSHKLAPPVPPSVCPFPPSDPFPEPLERFIPDPFVHVRPPRIVPEVSAICEIAAHKLIDDWSYMQQEAAGNTQSEHLSGRSVWGEAAAGDIPNQSLVSFSLNRFGFEDGFLLPEYGNSLRVNITSRLNAEFRMLFAETEGAVNSKVRALHSLVVSVGSQIYEAPGNWLIDTSVDSADLLYENDVPVGGSLQLDFEVPADEGRGVVVYEAITLMARASVEEGSRAYIGGTFTFDPLSVGMRGGCHPVTYMRVERK